MQDINNLSHTNGSGLPGYCRPTVDEMKETYKKIRQYAHYTPVLTGTAVNSIAAGMHNAGKLYFKCENFQKMGAFKFRGAVNALSSLPAGIHAVATHSSGNHAQALSLAAQLHKVKAWIVMPDNAPKVKVAAVKDYGGEIIFCRPTLQAREQGLGEVVAEKGAYFVHPSDNMEVIKGQGTACMELLEQVPELDVILAPVGGGGLLSGTAIAANLFSNRTQVIGVEPEGADDAYRSFKSDTFVPSINPNTVADGLLTSLGPNTFTIIRELVTDIVTVSDVYIIKAMRLIWERMKIIVEPSAAVSLGALLQGKFDVKGRKVGIILSGGNVDLDKLPWQTQT